MERTAAGVPLSLFFSHTLFSRRATVSTLSALLGLPARPSPAVAAAVCARECPLPWVRPDPLDGHGVRHWARSRSCWLGHASNTTPQHSAGRPLRRPWRPDPPRSTLTSLRLLRSRSHRATMPAAEVFNKVCIYLVAPAVYALTRLAAPRSPMAPSTRRRRVPRSRSRTPLSVPVRTALCCSRTFTTLTCSPTLTASASRGSWWSGFCRHLETDCVLRSQRARCSRQGRRSPRSLRGHPRHLRPDLR